MIRSNYTTLLLTIIVIILLFGVGIALYYVLDLDWFTKKTVDIYSEIGIYKETLKSQDKLTNKIKYDISKRTYNLILDTEDLTVIVYKDGTVGIKLKENDANKQVAIYKEILNKELKMDLSNIIRAYQVTVSKTNVPTTYILLLDVDGNLYSLDKQQLSQKGKYKFEKISGLGKIIDVKQITNDDLTENVEGINIIAVDEQCNEILLTQYLIK